MEFELQRASQLFQELAIAYWPIWKYAVPFAIGWLSAVPNSDYTSRSYRLLRRGLNGLALALGSHFITDGMKGPSDINQLELNISDIARNLYNPDFQPIQGEFNEIVSRTTHDAWQIARMLPTLYTAAYTGLITLAVPKATVQTLAKLKKIFPGFKKSSNNEENYSPTQFSEKDLVNELINFLKNVKRSDDYESGVDFDNMTDVNKSIPSLLISPMMSFRLIEQGSDPDGLIDLYPSDFIIIKKAIGEAVNQGILPREMRISRDDVQNAYNNFVLADRMEQMLRRPPQKPPPITIEEPEKVVVPQRSRKVRPPVRSQPERPVNQVPPKPQGRFLGIIPRKSRHEIIGQPPPEIPPIGHLFQEDLRNAVDFISPIILDKNPNLSFPERIKAITYAYNQGTLYYGVLEKALAEVYRRDNSLGPEYYNKLKKNCPVEFQGSKNFAAFREKFNLN